LNDISLNSPVINVYHNQVSKEYENPDIGCPHDTPDGNEENIENQTYEKQYKGNIADRLALSLGNQIKSEGFALGAYTKGNPQWNKQGD